MIIIVNLKPTLNPITAQERVKINENWDELRRALSNIQLQINLLGGTDVSVIVDTINQAISDAETKTQTAIDNVNDNYATKLVEINAMLSTLADTIQDTETTTQLTNDAKDAAILATTDARNAIAALTVDFSSKGQWNDSTQYIKNNLVLLDGSTYIAVQDNINTPVTDTNNWSLFAQRGEKGEQGDVGPIGQTGPQGVPGMNGSGAGTVISINGVQPDPSGEVTLLEKDIPDIVSKAAITTVVNRGSQVINSPKDTPVNLESFQGNTVGTLGIKNPTITNTTTGDSVTVQGTFHTGDVVNVENNSVVRAKREVVLDGSLPWNFSGTSVGFKTLATVIGTGVTTPIVIKYNGQVLTRGDASISADVFDLVGGTLFISVANIDTGWGQDFTPSQSEIKTYFTTNRYKLLYDLASPITESLNVIGSLRLVSGDNTLELTEGRIVRERINGYWDGSDYNFSRIDDGYTSSKLRFPNEDILNVYANGQPVEFLKNKLVGVAQGEYFGQIIRSLYNPTTIYEVDYIPLDISTISGPATPITINYRDTLGGVTEELVEDVVRLDNRVNSQQSVIDGTLQDIYSNAKKTQEEAWKTAVLRNGWAGTIKYRKNFLGLLEISIPTLTAGTVGALTEVTVLDPGYGTPGGTLAVIPLIFNSNGGIVSGQLYVNGDGQIVVAANSTIAVGDVFATSLVTTNK